MVQNIQQHTPVFKTEPDFASSKGEEPALLISNIRSLAPKVREQVILKKIRTKTADGTKLREQVILRKTITKSSETALKLKPTAEIVKQRQNLEIVLRNSNATPTRGHRGIGYLCYYCPKEFPDPADLKTHTLESHSDLKHKPQQKPPSINSFSVKLDITDLTCKLCFKMFSQLTLLMDHLKANHNQPIHTGIKDCLIPFRFDSDPMKCVLCDAEFNYFRMAIEHMNVHFRNYVCSICDAGFITSASMRNHKSSHQYGDYPCTECTQVLKSYAQFKYHFRYSHVEKGKRNKCCYCGEKFSSLIMKDNHQRNVHGVAPTLAKCKACDKTFQNHQSLRAHYNTYHLQIKNHKCMYCDMEFSGKHELGNHIVKHTGARDFECNICHKMFSRKSTLREHMRIHADDRRHKCDHCPMAFIQKCSLKSHLNSKHGIQID